MLQAIAGPTFNAQHFRMAPTEAVKLYQSFSTAGLELLCTMTSHTASNLTVSIQSKQTPHEIISPEGRGSPSVLYKHESAAYHNQSQFSKETVALSAAPQEGEDPNATIVPSGVQVLVCFQFPQTALAAEVTYCLRKQENPGHPGLNFFLFFL